MSKDVIVHRGYMQKGRPQTFTFELTDEQKITLDKIISYSNYQPKVIERAKILKELATYSVSYVIKNMHITKPRIYRLIHKFKTYGIEGAVFDLKRSGRPIIFTEDEKSYVRQIASQAPRDVDSNIDFDIWSASSLSHYLQNHPNGSFRIKKISPKEVLKLLEKTEIKLYVDNKKTSLSTTNKIEPFLYKRLEFLVTLKQDFLNQKSSIVIAYDDSKGSSVKKENRTYQLGVNKYTPSISNSILSLMIGINLLSGEILLQTSLTHTNESFILFLKKLEHHYATDTVINLILDKHKFHTSKQTYEFLRNSKVKFILNYEPKSVFYLNLFETFVSKLIRIKLNGLSADNYHDLEYKINLFVKELNSMKVVKRWDDDFKSLQEILS